MSVKEIGEKTWRLSYTSKREMKKKPTWCRKFPPHFPLIVCKLFNGSSKRLASYCVPLNRVHRAALVFIVFSKLETYNDYRYAKQPITCERGENFVEILPSWCIVSTVVSSSMIIFHRTQFTCSRVSIKRVNVPRLNEPPLSRCLAEIKLRTSMPESQTGNSSFMQPQRS